MITPHTPDGNLSTNSHKKTNKCVENYEANINTPFRGMWQHLSPKKLHKYVCFVNVPMEMETSEGFFFFHFLYHSYFGRRFSCAFILPWFNDRKISAVAFSQLNCLYRLAPNLPTATEHLTPAVIFHTCTRLSTRVTDKKQCNVLCTPQYFIRF